MVSMLILCCTQKLLKEMSIPKSELAESIETVDQFGTWYSNLIYLSRHKCVLFTNENTLYSFLVAGVKKADLKDIQALFLKHLRINLESEKIELVKIDPLISQYQTFKLASTISKSVLGSMNDMVHHCRYRSDRMDIFQEDSVLKLNKDLNRVPMKTIAYGYAIREMQELLGMGSA